jgi:hypothetical protein
MRRRPILSVALVVLAVLLPLGCRTPDQQVAIQSQTEGDTTDDGTVAVMKPEVPSPAGCTELATFNYNINQADRAIAIQKAQQAVIEPLQQSGTTLAQVAPEITDSVKMIVSDLLARLNSSQAGGTPESVKPARQNLDQYRADHCMNGKDGVSNGAEASTTTTG